MRNLLIGLCALSVVVMLGMFTASIWANDARWAATAMVLLFASFGFGATATYTGWEKK